MVCRRWCKKRGRNGPEMMEQVVSLPLFSGRVFHGGPGPNKMSRMKLNLIKFK